MLSLQECAHPACRQPAAFFFDGNTYERKKDLHKTHFLEYFQGHGAEVTNWDDVRTLADCLPGEFQWERAGYSQRDVIEGEAIVFRDFDREYLRPDYLLDAVWSVIDDQPRGYLHLVGPEGAGKSYAAKGLGADGPSRGVTVLVYHIRPGALSDYRTFISELADRARDQLEFRTQEIQTNVSRHTELPAQFSEFARTLMELNNLGTLVIVLDALDELRRPASDAAALITDFLPPVEDLPDRCFVVLTSRAALHPRVAQRLDRLRQAGPDAFRTLALDPAAASNRAIVRSYLGTNLPAAFRSPALVESLLDRAGGVFHYAAHFAHALAAGVFPTVAALPAPADYYPAYLDRLCARVGAELFETVYRPILGLLAAAFQPVTLRQLNRWGVPEARLRFALYDLGDFLQVQRQLGWHDTLDPGTQDEPRYTIAHDAFVRYLGEHCPDWLRDAHGLIGRSSLPSGPSGWSDLDPTDDAQLYALRHVLPHLEAAGPDEALALVRGDEAYASRCFSAGYFAGEKARHLIAEDLYDRALDVYRELVDQEGRTELANDLASALMNKGVALDSQGRLGEAVVVYDQAIAIRTRLVEQEGRSELANDLAKALMNKALVLEKQEQWADALACYEQAIRWCEACVQAGMVHLLGELLQNIRYRMMTFLDLGRRDEAAADVVRLLDHAAPALQSGAPPEAVMEELNALVGLLRGLPDDAWNEVEAGLGSWGEVVRSWVRGPG
jgi:tetratricopeptide (TPR) repeat protein